MSSGGDAATRTKVTLNSNESDGTYSIPIQKASEVEAVVPDPVDPQVLQDLKLQVLSLKQRKEILKQESTNIKLEMISPAELMLIKTQINLNSSSSSLTKIDDLTVQYTETMRAISALKMSCLGSERRIRDELERREEILEEIDTLNSYLQIDHFDIQTPVVSEMTDKGDILEIESLEKRLISLKAEISRHKHNLNSPLFTDAAKYIAKAADAQSSLDNTLSIAVREEIDKLREKNDIIALKVRNRKAEIKDFRVKFEEILNQPLPEKCFCAGNELHELEEKLTEQRMKLEASQNTAVELDREINRIRLMPKPVFHTRVYEEVREAVSDDDDEFDTEMTELSSEYERSLATQASILRAEVAELEQKYANAKRNAQSRQAEGKLKIRKLKKQYERCQVEISKQQGLTDGNEERQIGCLFDKIEGRLAAMTQELCLM